MPNLYCPNVKCTYYGGSGLIISMQPEYHKNCSTCGAKLTLTRPPPRKRTKDLDESSYSFESFEECDEVLPEIVHYMPSPLVRKYSGSEEHSILIEPTKKRSSTLRTIFSSRPRNFKRPRHCVMDELADQDGITVATGVPYHSAISDGLTFLRSKMPSVALQYSAYYHQRKNDTGPCNFMLGWDHAMILRRGDLGWYAHSVYSADYRPPTPKAEAQVWRLSHRKERAALTGPVKLIIPGSKSERDRTWYGFDLSKEELLVDYVVTLGLTSCSFACLFNDDYIIISHMSTKSIPVAWLAAVVLDIDDSVDLKLLVSHHGDPDEFNKYTTTKGMPFADLLSIDSILCSRGVKHIQQDGATPSLSHPYMGLNLTSPDAVSCFSVLGYNNDPELHVEMPPLHIVWPGFYNKLRTTTSTQLVIDILADCHQGNYGFEELYGLMFAELVQEHSIYRIRNKKDFTSPLIKKLHADLKPTTTWGLFTSRQVPAKAKLPKFLRGWAQIVFLMVDVIQNFASTETDYRAFRAALLRAWNKYQKGFNFDLSEFDSFVIPKVPKQRKVPKHILVH